MGGSNIYLEEEVYAGFINEHLSVHSFPAGLARSMWRSVEMNTFLASVPLLEAGEKLKAK